MSVEDNDFNDDVWGNLDMCYLSHYRFTYVKLCVFRM